MVLEIIRDSVALQAIVWGFISWLFIKNILKYLPPLIKELKGSSK